MKHLILVLILFLTGCSTLSGLNLGSYPDPNASKDEFIYCYGYGCRLNMRLGFSNYQWKNIGEIFKKKPNTAKEERQKIAKAIALMEKYTGALAGTEDDLPKAPILGGSNQELDCIDETINTTKYLNFLTQENLLVLYDVGKPTHKGYLVDGVYPHNTATIQEKSSGQIYVVDSYIFKNGDEPVIRTLEDWLAYKTFESEEY